MSPRSEQKKKPDSVHIVCNGGSRSAAAHRKRKSPSDRWTGGCHRDFMGWMAARCGPWLLASARYAGRQGKARGSRTQALTLPAQRSEQQRSCGGTSVGGPEISHPAAEDAEVHVTARGV
jgi:hypothetical protein